MKSTVNVSVACIMTRGVLECVNSGGDYELIMNWKIYIFGIELNVLYIFLDLIHSDIYIYIYIRQISKIPLR